VKNLRLSVAVLGCMLLCGCVTPWNPGFKDYNYSVPKMIGYGCDNFWDTQDHPKMAKDLASAGCNITSIEFFTHDKSKLLDPSSLAEPFAKLLQETRKRHIVIFVCIWNDNIGNGQGDNGHHDASYYMPQMRQARDIVMSHGPEGLIVQAVAETQTSGGSKFESESAAILNAAGFKTAYNHGSRPSSKDGCWVAAYHPCSLTDMGKDGQIVISDCGIPIAFFGDGDKCAKKFNPSKCADWVGKVHAAGRGVVVYGFWNDPYDAATIKAVGAVNK